MKKFTQVCLIITAVLVMLGISMCAVGVVMGGAKSFGEIWSNGDLAGLARLDRITESGWYDRDEWTNTGGTVYTYKEDEISSINISLHHGSLEIEESDTREITAALERDNGKLEVYVKDGTLWIEDQRTGSRARSDCEVTLKLPRDMMLEEVEIENSAGILEWDDTHLKAKNVKIEVGAGEAVIEALDTENFTIEVGAGNAEIDRLNVQKVSADCGAGEIDLEICGSEKDYNYEINCGIGSIEVNEKDYVSLGKELHVDNQAKNDISLNCGIGLIVLETTQGYN